MECIARDDPEVPARPFGLMFDGTAVSTHRDCGGYILAWFVFGFTAF